jgi:DNA-binding HxlR family transcriptional regulator
MELAREPMYLSPLRVEFSGCPVKASLDVLGRKWALLVLRNIGLYQAQRFNEMLRITPGLTKRVLAMRLKELEAAGFIRPEERGRNFTRWGLTEKGEDALPILMTLVHFGSKWYADQVFADQRARKLTDVFEPSYIRRVLGEMTAVAASGGRKGQSPASRGRGIRPAVPSRGNFARAASSS